MKAIPALSPSRPSPTIYLFPLCCSFLGYADAEAPSRVSGVQISAHRLPRAGSCSQRPWPRHPRRPTQSLAEKERFPFRGRLASQVAGTGPRGPGAADRPTPLRRPPLCLLTSLSLFLFLSVPLPVCSVEDVANLTASDVMNRVNLGYLQGNFAPADSAAA